ncbi:MAG: hypothetical protein ACTHOH_09660 [Lysobacteraceae bacterium]
MKTQGKIALGLVLALSAGAAIAGARVGPYTVTINDASRIAYGAFADARASADTQQWIGCNYNAAAAFCTATNAAGISRSCSTTNAALIDAIHGISSESYVYFQWNTDGTCSYVLVENSSRFKPAATSGT